MGSSWQVHQPVWTKECCILRILCISCSHHLTDRNVMNLSIRIRENLLSKRSITTTDSYNRNNKGTDMFTIQSKTCNNYTKQAAMTLRCSETKLLMYWLTRKTIIQSLGLKRAVARLFQENSSDHNKPATFLTKSSQSVSLVESKWVFLT